MTDKYWQEKNDRITRHGSLNTALEVLKIAGMVAQPKEILTEALSLARQIEKYVKESEAME